MSERNLLKFIERCGHEVCSDREISRIFVLDCNRWGTREHIKNVRVLCKPHQQWWSKRTMMMGDLKRKEQQRISDCFSIKYLHLETGQQWEQYRRSLDNTILSLSVIKRRWIYFSKEATASFTFSSHPENRQRAALSFSLFLPHIMNVSCPHKYKFHCGRSW